MLYRLLVCCLCRILYDYWYNNRSLADLKYVKKKKIVTTERKKKNSTQWDFIKPVIL